MQPTDAYDRMELADDKTFLHFKARCPAKTRMRLMMMSKSWTQTERSAMVQSYVVTHSMLRKLFYLILRIAGKDGHLYGQVTI